MTVYENQPFDGINNVRDFGGYSSRYGRIRHDRLLRSAALDEASDQDLEILDGLNLDVVIDLRSTAEREMAPSRRSSGFSGRVIEVQEVDGNEPPHLRLIEGRQQPAVRLHAAMQELYRSVTFDPGHLLHFSRALKAMANTSGAVLVHCAAGKDRTGIFVALVQQILGVPWDISLQDYLRSGSDLRLKARLRERVRLIAQLKGVEVDAAGVEVLSGVDASYLQSAWDEIHRRCGSLENYCALAGVDNLVLVALRAQFIEQEV